MRSYAAFDLDRSAGGWPGVLGHLLLFRCDGLVALSVCQMLTHHDGILSPNSMVKRCSANDQFCKGRFHFCEARFSPR